MHVEAMAAALLLAAAFSISSPALAQDDAALLRDGLFARDRNISVLERPKPEYDFSPIHVGALLFTPTIASSFTYDDNIYASNTIHDADAIVAVSPSVSLSSDWTRNQISAFAKIDQAFYLDHSGEDTTDYAADFAGRLDVRRDLGVAGGIGFERDTEPRTSEASPLDAVHPIQYDVAGGWIESSKIFDRLRVTARGSLQDYAYDNAEASGGGEIDQHDQDRTESVAAGRAEYVYSPELSLLTSLSVDRRQYRNAAPGEAARSSNGYEATVGASFDLARLLRGQVGVGYLDRTYERPAFKGAEGLALDGKVEYFPTTLTTITTTASRRVQDSGIPGVGGYIASAAAAQIDHELLRNLVLSGRFAYAENSYIAYSRKDEFVTSRFSGSYLLNRLLSLLVSYDRLLRRSHGADAGQEYAVNRVTASISCKF